MNHPYLYTTQRAIRAAFWRDHAGVAGVSRKRIKNYSGNGTMHNTDTRCAFTDYIDMLSRNGDISEELASRVTLA